MEEEYKKKGMTEEEAAVAAYKREKTEKILAATLGVSVAAAAAYGAYKYHDYAFDKVIPAGTSLQNISGFANRGVQDAFYAAVNESDKTRYKGWYAHEKMKETGEAHLSNFIATQNAKIASDKNATKILGSLLKNNGSFRSDVEQKLKINSMYNPYNSKLYSKALSDVKKGKITNTVYQAVNSGLVGRDPSSTNIKNTFYNELSKNGYAGIMDTNDRRKSIFKLANGYNTKSPMILFGGSNYFKTNRSRQMLPSEIKENFIKANKAYKRETDLVKFSQRAALGAGYGVLGAAGFGAGRYVTRKNDDKIVAKYRKEHPETKLSYKEILRMQKSK